MIISNLSKKEKLYTSWYGTKGKFNSNQILDFHWDWICENNSLIILNELDAMEEGWKLELMGNYINMTENKNRKGSARFIITQHNDNGLIGKLCGAIHPIKDYGRNKIQVLRQNLSVIDLSRLGNDQDKIVSNL